MKNKNKIPPNQHDLKVGTVIIRVGTVTPENLELESEGLCEGWDRVRNTDALALERSLRSSGWHMCYLAGSSQSSIAVGTLDQKRIRTASLRLLAKLRSQMFNCVELTELSAKRFAGIPYVRVTGHARQIQREMQVATFVTRRDEINRSALQSRPKDIGHPQRATGKDALARS
jgi:hypothetical protein